MNTSGNNSVAIVVIGRNEGTRLEYCFQSVLRETKAVVYVDSDSSDDSVAIAHRFGVAVIELDRASPFSAGRARNEGFYYLVQSLQNIKYVQFIDGDCELQPGWLKSACRYLDSNSSCAVIAGRLKEKFPEKSIYNRLCDHEWDTPIGEVNACGGIFVVRSRSFNEVGGFNPAVIAGEEPELCYRLRKEGWKIHRIEQLMALHDADMTSFSQWWRRSIRSGFAYAQAAYLHRESTENYRLKECLRIWLWALVIPLSIVLLMSWLSVWYVFGISVYIIHFLRSYRLNRKYTDHINSAFLYSYFSLLDKFPQLIGQIKFILHSILKKKTSLIEYK